MTNHRRPLRAAAADPALHDEAELASFRDRIRQRLADNGAYAGIAAAELFKRIAAP